MVGKASKINEILRRQHKKARVYSLREAILLTSKSHNQYNNLRHDTRRSTKNHKITLLQIRCDCVE